MSALAVKTFVQNSMALLNVPVETIVFSQEPKEVSGEQAVVVIAIPQMEETRFTFSRPVGRKQVIHHVRLDVYSIATDEQQGGRWFDGLLWQIDHLFRHVTIPVTISDEDNGEQSSILLIGEDVQTRVNAPLLDENIEGLVRFSAEKTMTVVEQLVG